MLEIKNYVKAESLEQAYELNQKRNNKIIGGMLWMKMGTRSLNTAIDLSGLGLDQIEENETEYRIGAMVTLRQLEQHVGLNEMTNGAMRESVRHIIGVQFRNLATIGGSIFGRFGFSDVLTMFLALDAKVELYHGGIVSMREFNKTEPDNDILVSVIVDKKPVKAVYQSIRNSETDFPVITCAVSCIDDTYCAVFGARPSRAKEVVDTEGILKEITDENIKAFAEQIKEQVRFGSNNRGGKEYRELMVDVLLRRGIQTISGGVDNGN